MQRQFNRENATHPFPAGDVQFGAVRCADRLYDRQTQSSSAGLARASLVCAVKAFEDMREGIVGYSGAIVRNLEDRGVRLAAYTHFNLAAILRVLDSIRDEVHDHLLEMRAVSLNINVMGHGAGQLD